MIKIAKQLNEDLIVIIYKHFSQYMLLDTILTDEEHIQLKLDIPIFKHKYILSEDKKTQESLFDDSELICLLLESSLTKKIAEFTSIDDLLEYKVLDPNSCGGFILVNVYKKLADKALSELAKDIDPNFIKGLILKNCIYAVESDDFASDVTKLILFIISGQTEHFKNIIHKDFLAQTKQNGYKTPELSDLFGDICEGFSLIIGKPPYYNFYNLDPKLKKFYTSRYSSAFQRFDIYILFIEQSLKNFLSKTGILAFIVPDKFLTQNYAKKSRHLILQNFSIKQIIYYKRQYLFKNTCTFPVIITVDPIKEANSYIIATEMKKESEQVSYLNQDSFFNLYNYSFRIGWNIHKQEIIEKVQSKSFPLHEACYISRGVKPSELKKNIFNSIYKVNENKRKFLKPLLRPSCIERYGVFYSGEYFLYKNNKSSKAQKFLLDELYKKNKIVFVETSALNGIVSSFDSENFYTNHSIINCIHKKDLLDTDKTLLSFNNIKIIDEKNYSSFVWKEDKLENSKELYLLKESNLNNLNLKYLLSIVNSKLINFYFKNFLMGELNIFQNLIKFMPVFNLYLTSDQHFKDNYFEYLFAKNDFEGIKQIAVGLIRDKIFLDLHNLLVILAQRLIYFKKHFFIQEFMIVDEILNVIVYTLYDLDINQIDYIENNFDTLIK